MIAFDWPAVMRAGMLGLRLTPIEFWRLTPAELRLMLGQTARQTAMGRAGLEALMSAYPDTVGDTGEHDE